VLVAGCARSGDRGAPGDVSGTAHDTTLRGIPVVALRLSGGGGGLRAYALPGLAELPWPIGGRTSPAGATVGMDAAGQRLLYRDTSGAVAAFDLVAFHERTIAPRGSLASLGADGALLAVDRRGVVVESRPWGTRQWPDTLGAGVREIFAAPGARLLVLRAGRGDSLLSITRDGGVSYAAAVPEAAERAASRDGDALALATDSGLVVLEDRELRVPWFVRLTGTPRAVVFSPSGHRIYVALRDRSELAVVDRYLHEERPAIPLPGSAGTIRPDPWGRALLVRPSGAERPGDETWIVSLARNRVIGSLATEWDTDLPTVSSTGVVLSREGDAVVTHDVHTLVSLGEIADGAADFWFVGAWAPSGAAAAVRQQVRAADTAHSARAEPAVRQQVRAADTAHATRTEPARPARTAEPRPAPPPPPATPPAESENARRLWVQVSASQSESASRELMAVLQAARHPVQLVPPRSETDGWRVVVGPYATRDEAEAAGRALGRPFFIVERSLPAPARP
jgi:hypothetical protein